MSGSIACGAVGIAQMTRVQIRTSGTRSTSCSNPLAHVPGQHTRWRTKRAEAKMPQTLLLLLLLRPLLLLLLCMSPMTTAGTWPWRQAHVGRHLMRHTAACPAVSYPWLPTPLAASLANSAPLIMRPRRYAPRLITIGSARSAFRPCGSYITPRRLPLPSAVPSSHLRSSHLRSCLPACVGRCLLLPLPAGDGGRLRGRAPRDARQRLRHRKAQPRVPPHTRRLHDAHLE